MKKQYFISPALLLLLLFAAPHRVDAQVLYGSLTGNVTDPSGAAVAGAKVEAKNIGTGVSNILSTDERGAYLFNNLQVGVYKVTITTRGFKTLIQDNVGVEANTTRRVDAQMQVGEVTDAVQVSADTPPLQTDRADVNITLPSREVNDLPIFGSVGRNYQTLMMLVPGTSRSMGFSNNGSGEENSAAGNPQRSVSYNVNGVSRLQNNTKIDGASVVYPWLPTNTVYVPPSEAIQEVNIVTNAFDAEQGLAGGAAVNVSIKTGTNTLHGVGWGYDTNSALLSRNFFQPVTQKEPPKNILAQFGYAIGGPVYIPKVINGKNKLFFFTDLERTTQRNAAGATATVATASLRPDANGNVNFSGTGTTVYDPLSNPDPHLRTPFPNNTIPANRIDPAALELIKRLPMPNLPGSTSNFATSGVAEFNRNNIDTKINYDSGGRLTIFGRYSISPATIIDPPIFGEISGPALNGGQLGTAPGRTQVIGFGGTYTFRPTLILDVNAGYTRQHIGAEAFDIGSNFGLDVLKIPGTNGPDHLQGGVPSFQIGGGYTDLGNDNTGNPFVFRDNQYVAAANITWLRGAHAFRFGFDYLNPQLNHFQPQGGTFQTVRGTFAFSGNVTSLQGGAAATQFNHWADFLLGLPTNAGKVDQLRNPNSVYWKQYAFYARDHWQISSRVTLTYGLRYERFPVPTKDNTGINRFDPTTGQVLTGGLDGVPYDTGAEAAGLLLPRLGVAFRLNDKTVIRGGYGQSADPRPFQDVRNAYPIANIWSMPTVKFNGADNSFLPVTNLRQGLINTSTPPDVNAGVIPLPTNTGTTTFPKKAERDRIHTFNFFIERELPRGFTTQVGYVGTRAVGQMGFININAAPPASLVSQPSLVGNPSRPLFPIIADINSIQPYATSTYDALQAVVTRRWRGSLFGTSYTWSKAIDYADNDGGPRIQYMPAKERNRGLAGYDRTSNLETYWVYDLPFGKGQRWANAGGLVSKLIGGFQFSGVMSIMSGLPVYVVQNTAPNLQAPGSAQIPNQLDTSIDYLGGVGLLSQRGTARPWFDNTVLGVNCTSNCAWALENGGQFGNVGRNNLRGPGFFEADASIFRTFAITEKVQFQLRAEALNALNHANFANPQADVNNSNFGYINGTVGPNQARQWRFGARVSF